MSFLATAFCCTFIDKFKTQDIGLLLLFLSFFFHEDNDPGVFMGDYAQLNTEKLNSGNLQRHHLHQSISDSRNRIITGNGAIVSLWTSS